jgi:hypothetical protein
MGRVNCAVNLLLRTCSLNVSVRSLGSTYGPGGRVLDCYCRRPRCECSPALFWEDVLRRTAQKIALALLLLTAPLALYTPAQAVSINISVGTNLNNGRSISCREGERRLRNRGFQDVRRIDCRGRFFVYRAWRGGQRFEIALNSRNGRVSDVRRLGR